MAQTLQTAVILTEQTEFRTDDNVTWLLNEIRSNLLYIYGNNNYILFFLNKK